MFAWADANPTFAAALARAREVGCDAIADDVLDIADNGNPDDTNRARLRAETRLKLLAKWNPKKYGDKLQLDADLRVSITVNDPFAPLPATAQLLPPTAGAVTVAEIPAGAADGRATPVPPRSAAELCRVPVSENSAQPFQQYSPVKAALASESTPMALGRATRRSQPAGDVRISPRTGKPVRPYTRRQP